MTAAWSTLDRMNTPRGKALPEPPASMTRKRQTAVMAPSTEPSECQNYIRNVGYGSV